MKRCAGKEPLSERKEKMLTRYREAYDPHRNGETESVGCGRMIFNGADFHR